MMGRGSGSQTLMACHTYTNPSSITVPMSMATFFVSPVDESLFALVLEHWEIWLRWDSAFKRGEVSVQSHPALPEDRERHEVLKVAIGDRLRVDRAQAKYMKARFQTSSGKTVVEWTSA
jgi:hypothetical protein